MDLTALPLRFHFGLPIGKTFTDNEFVKRFDISQSHLMTSIYNYLRVSSVDFHLSSLSLLFASL